MANDGDDLTKTVKSTMLFGGVIAWVQVVDPLRFFWQFVPWTFAIVFLLNIVTFFVFIGAKAASHAYWRKSDFGVLLLNFSAIALHAAIFIALARAF